MTVASALFERGRFAPQEELQGEPQGELQGELLDPFGGKGGKGELPMRWPHRRHSPWLACLLGLACLGSPGCAGKKPSLKNPGGAFGILEALREEEGLASWNKYAFVRFSYRIFLPAASSGIPKGIYCPEVAFRTNNYRRLWVSLEAGKAPKSISLEGPPGAVVHALLEGEDPGSGDRKDWTLDSRALLGVDFALRSIRYFLSLPLATSAGRWEFRSLLAPPEMTSPAFLEAAPLEPSAPLGQCVLGEREKDGLLSKLVYASKHPYASSAPLVLVLDDYRVSGGVKIARRRAHLPTRSDSVEPDPFPEEGKAPRGEPWVLREEVDDVLFLEAREGEERYKERGEE
jgi:hypothetical protein